MYFDAVITPVILGSSPGIIKKQTAAKKLSKTQSSQYNDADQPYPPRLTPPRPHTVAPYSQPVSLLSRPSQPRHRTRSITQSDPSSIKKKSMSFVSLLFNRNIQQSRSNSGSSTSLIDHVEAKQTNLFKRSKPTTAETRTPPSGHARPRIHRLSRSFSSTPNCHVRDHSPPFPFSTPAFQPLSPSPTSVKRFGHASRRSYESCISDPDARPPNSALWKRFDGKGSQSAALPAADGADADALYVDDDACSTISSICFADDPDEKPPNMGKCRESTISSIAEGADSPVTRLNRDSFVLDISGSHRVSDEQGDNAENEVQEAGIPRAYRRKDKLLHLLGESPLQHPQTHQRRHSCSTASVSSARSHWSTNSQPSAELNPSWSLPDIPVVSPLTASNLVPSTPFPMPIKPSPPTSSSSTSNTVTRKRRSTLLIPGVEGLTAFLRPLEASDARRFPHAFRTSTFSSSSTTLSPRIISSVPSTLAAQVTAPQSHPSVPPGLDAHIQSSAEQKALEIEIENEDKKGKSRAYRDSNMTEDSAFADLHRLPPSLLDDSLDSQSVRFNTAPSTPTLLSCASPSLSTSSTSESNSQSPALSFSSTAQTLRPTIAISSPDNPSPTGASTPTHPIALIPSVSLVTPRSISPSRNLTSPLPQAPKPPIRSFSSLSPLSVPSIASTGIELILDPVDSSFDQSVSPIIFASADGDEYSFDRYLGDLSDDDSVTLESWGSQDGIKTVSLFEGETKRKREKKANLEEKRNQRIKDNNGWGSVRVPLRKKSSGLGKDKQDGTIPSQGARESTNWVGEWNSDMHSVIRQLRALR